MQAFLLWLFSFDKLIEIIQLWFKWSQPVTFTVNSKNEVLLSDINFF